MTNAIRPRCERLTDPLGIDRARPSFEWVPDGEQTAYQLLVATDPAVASGDVWDSGQIRSDRISARYAGAPLASGRRYWWTVRLWDSDGTPGPYAPPATFEMGLLDPADWRGSWIGGVTGVSSPLLRNDFAVTGRVRTARAYVAALGYYELRLNGARVGDRVLEPATTTYTHDPELVDSEGKPTRIPNPRVLYSTYDVTEQIRHGANAAGLILGHGWYSAEPDNGPGPFPRTPYGDRPAALVQLVIETDDGRTTVVSGDDWRTAPGPIVYNDYAQGEKYDARLAPSGWDSPGFADSDWTPAVPIDPPANVLRSQPVEPIRVIETLSPVDAGARPIVDFGQHISGWTRIRVSGPAGAEVTLRHAGEVTEDGELDDDANMGAWLAARQTDTYVLKGDSEEVWEPRFTLHGFRYVEVTTSHPDVAVRELAGRVVHSDLRRTGEFECSEELLNRIHRNVLWSFRASFQGFPQDAADRAERVGWVGDPGWSIEDYLYDFDARAFWLKWLDDLADTQLPDGQFPTVCPIHWRGRIDVDQSEYEIPEGQEVPPTPHWPYTTLPDFAMTSYPSIAWHLYRFYGDEAALREHYPAMRRGLAYLRSRTTDLILREGLGDHMEPQPDGSSSVSPRRTPMALTSTAWFHAVTTMAADAAEVIGEDADAAEYRDLATAIRKAFNDEFLDPSTGRYATGSQTAQAMPLWVGLVPDEHRSRVVRALIEQIQRDNGNLATGTMGTAALQHVLTDAGAAEVMYDIATKTTLPSWGYQVERGATTVWETWGGDKSYSRNMKLLATIGTFLYNDVAGLAPTGPGWRTIRVRPSLTGRLTHARARVSTVRGDAAVDWRLEDEALVLNVEIPATSTAEVWLPVDQFGPAPVITVNGTAIATDGDRPVVVGGGVHSFQLTRERADA